MKNLKLYAVCHHEVQNCMLLSCSLWGLIAWGLSSDDTESDFQVLELEPSSRSIAVSKSGAESDLETSEVFVSKAATIFNSMDQYIYWACFSLHYSHIFPA